MKLDVKTIEYLYNTKGLSQVQIAEKFGVSRQAVNERMTKAGIPRRKTHTRRKPTADIDVKELYRVYVTENRNQKETARYFGVGQDTISSWLDRNNIPKHPGRRSKYYELEQLEVGDSIIYKKPRKVQPFADIYMQATKLKIKVTIQSILGDRMRVTRVA